MATLLGLMVVTVLLVFYALHKRTYWLMQAAIAAAAAGSTYDFAQGVWPIGMIEAAWAIIVARKWWLLHQASPRQSNG